MNGNNKNYLANTYDLDILISAKDPNMCGGKNKECLLIG